MTDARERPEKPKGAPNPLLTACPSTPEEFKAQADLQLKIAAWQKSKGRAELAKRAELRAKKYFNQAREGDN